MGRPLRCGKAAFAAAGIALATAAPAQTVDLTRTTCADYATLSAADRDQLAVWLHGYFAGAAQRSSLDPTRVAASAALLQKACEVAAAMPLIGPATRAIFLGEPVPAASATTPQPRGPAR